MEEYLTRMEGITMSTTPDGDLIIVMEFEQRAFVQSHVTARWLASLVNALGEGSLSLGPVGYDCRVRVDRATNMLVAVGHANSDDHWFDVVGAQMLGNTSTDDEVGRA